MIFVITRLKTVITKCSIKESYHEIVIISLQWQARNEKGRAIARPPHWNT